MVHRSESELTLDNILFERRNKSYGAYDIRNIYNSHLKTAIVIGATIFTLALLSPQIAQFLKKEEEIVEEVIIKEVILAEPPPIDETLPPPPPPPSLPNYQPPQVASTEFLPPVIKEDDEVPVEQEPPTQSEMANSNPGETTQAGDPGADLNAVIETGTPGGTGTSAEVEEKPALFVSQMPTFAEGDYRLFVQKNMKYPSEAEEAGTQGKVHLKFVVEKDGGISDIKVVKSLGNGCDEEAIRVVKLMNGKFKPGLNNGKPTRVFYNLAIDFQLRKR